MDTDKQLATAASPRDVGRMISAWELAAGLIRNSRFIRWGVSLGGIVGLSWALLSPAEYRSAAIIRPVFGEGAGGQLSSLAAQFGVAVPTMADRDSPEFYEELVFSRTILDSIVAREWQPNSREITTLDAYLRIDDDDPAIRREKVLRWLRDDALAVEVSRVTGSVTLAVTTESAILSQSLLNEVIALLNRFNSSIRQSQAMAEREFVEKQFVERRLELRLAEDSLRNFLDRNRDLTNSPMLQFTRDRLSREVAFRQQIVTSLGQALEQARIAEVRNTPRVSVVQHPNLPVQPERRRRVLKLGLMVLLGAGAGAGLAAFTYVSQQVSSEDEAHRDEVLAWVAQFKRLIRIDRGKAA